MKTGDRIRLLKEWNKFPTGKIGKIHSHDWINDMYYVTLDDKTYSFKPEEFMSMWSVIQDPPAIPCPVALKKWFDFVTPYIGRRDD